MVGVKESGSPRCCAFMFRHVSPALLGSALARSHVVVLVGPQMAGGAQRHDVGPLAVLGGVVPVVHGEGAAVRVERLSQPAALLPALLALPASLLLDLGGYLVPVVRVAVSLHRSEEHTSELQSQR